jgi:hypothetical protein
LTSASRKMTSYDPGFSSTPKKSLCIITEIIKTRKETELVVKLIVAQLVKKFTAFYWTRISRFITVFTRAFVPFLSQINLL